MVIGIFGESCVGKSALAERLKTRLGAEVYTGKDFLRLAKSEAEAKRIFQGLLQAAMDGAHVIYVIAEREHLSLLPEGAVRVLVTAGLETIKARFAQRMGGTLPAPVAGMLERKHGMFDSEPHHVHVKSEETELDAACEQVLRCHPALGRTPDGRG